MNLVKQNFEDNTPRNRDICSLENYKAPNSEYERSIVHEVESSRKFNS